MSITLKDTIRSINNFNDNHLLHIAFNSNNNYYYYIENGKKKLKD